MKTKSARLRKGMAAIVSILLVAGLLGACSGEGASSAPQGGASSSGAAGTTTESADNQEPVTVTIGGWGYMDHYVPVLQRELAKIHPNITIEFERMEYQDYVNKLKINLSAGTSWDIMQLQSGALIEVSKDYCMPLNDFVEESWGKDWKSKFVDGVADTGIFDNKVLGLPDTVSLSGMVMYNKTLLEKNNLSVPTTYEELKAYTQKARADGLLPLLIGGKDGWINIDMFTVICNDIAPGKLNQADAGTIAWDDPELVKALAAWQNLFSDGIFQDGALGVPQYPTVSEMYWQSHQGVALCEGDWCLGSFTDPNTAEQSNLDAHTFAAFPDMNGDGKPCAPTFSPGILYAMNKNLQGTKAQAAWDYVEWMVGEEGVRVMNSPECGHVSTPAFKAQTIERVSDSKNFLGCTEDLAKLAQRTSGPREMSDAAVKTVLGEVLQELGAGLTPEAAAAKLKAVRG